MVCFCTVMTTRPPGFWPNVKPRGLSTSVSYVLEAPAVFALTWQNSTNHSTNIVAYHSWNSVISCTHTKYLDLHFMHVLWHREDEQDRFLWLMAELQQTRAGSRNKKGGWQWHILGKDSLQCRYMARSEAGFTCVRKQFPTSDDAANRQNLKVWMMESRRKAYGRQEPESLKGSNCNWASSCSDTWFQQCCSMKSAL